MCTVRAGFSARARLVAAGAAGLLGGLFATAGQAAPIQFDDVSAAAGFTNVTTTYGASWGDLNGDGLPDLFANNHSRPNSIYLNNGNGTFSDVAEQVEVTDFWTGSGRWEDTHGGSWVDFDNDGDQDLVVSTGDCCDPQFFVNENGLLNYRTIEMGFGDDVDKGGRMPVWFDYDDDGLLETMIASFYPAPFMKQSSGSFYRLPWSNLQCKDNQYAVMLDIDEAGDLDLICVDKGAEFAQKAYDLSSSPFQELGAELPADTGVNDIIIGDYDGDLRNDILLLRGALRPSEVAIFDGTKLEAQLINNDRGFSFRSTGVLSVRIDWNKSFTNNTNIWIGDGGDHPPGESFTLDPADPDVAGVRPRDPKSYPEIYIGYDPATQTWDFDLYAPVWTYLFIDIQSTAPMTQLETRGIGFLDGPVQPVLYANRASGFEDVTDGSGLDSQVRCVSGTTGDFDNDMDLDIYLACRGGVSNIPNRMYENNGDGTFTLVPNEGGANSVTGSSTLDSRGTSENVVTADYDADGLLDIFLTNGLNMRPHGRDGGPDQLFRNTGDPRQWIELDLVGTVSNRDGVGARVYATAGGVTQYREQNGGYHRWAQNHQRIHFGLADNPTVDLEVQWPSGIVQTFDDVAAGSIYKVNETSGIEAFDPYEGSPPGADDECYEPAYNAGAEFGVFVWRDCDGSGEWHVRATAGGSQTTVEYAGVITSSLGFDTLQPFSFESGDSLVNSPDPNRADFILRMIRSGEDGLDFALPDGSDSCFDVTNAPPGAQVMLGIGRVPVTPPFDLETQESCSVSEPPPSGAGQCGSPGFDSATDAGLFVWKDCDADRWHVRGGSEGWTRFVGSVNSTGAITNLTPFNIEPADDLDQPASGEVTFNMGLSQPWTDGFAFTASCTDTLNLQLDSPFGEPIVIGSERTEVTSPVALSDFAACEP